MCAANPLECWLPCWGRVIPSPGSCHQPHFLDHEPVLSAWRPPERHATIRMRPTDDTRQHCIDHMRFERVDVGRILMVDHSKKYDLKTDLRSLLVMSSPCEAPCNAGGRSTPP